MDYRRRTTMGSGLAWTITILQLLSMVSFAFALYAIGQPAIREAVLISIVISGLLWIVSGIVFLFWLHAAWACLAGEPGKVLPGLAVGLMFVPLFNLYWVFRMIPGLSWRLTGALKRRSSSQVFSAGMWLGLASVILSLISAFASGEMLRYHIFEYFILLIVPCTATRVLWVNTANRACQELLRVSNEATPVIAAGTRHERSSLQANPA